MRRLAIWASGYSRSVSNSASPEDLEHLAKLGGTVVATALWTAIAWALAVTTYAKDASATQIAIVAVIAAAGGFGFVVLFDRAMLYAMDARADGRIPVTWLVFRLTVVLALGTLTSERLFPVILNAELQQQALNSRETSDAGRQLSLDRRFQTPQLGRRAEASETSLRGLEREAAQIPAAVQAVIDRARVCALSLNRERRRLLAAGFGRQEVRRQVLAQSQMCRATDLQARRALADYREEMRARIAEMRARASNDRARYSSAATAVEQRVNEARAIEAESLTPHSSEVFWSLIANNPIALLKTLVLLIIMLSIELLPFIIKGFAGRTGMGARLGAARAIGIIDAETRLACHENESAIAIEASRAVSVSMIAALQGSEVQEFIRERCADQACALAPFEVALRTLRMAESKKREIDSLASRTPELAAMAHALLANAIREAGDNLRPMAA